MHCVVPALSKWFWDQQSLMLIDVEEALEYFLFAMWL